MPVTILYNESDAVVEDAASDGADLWLRLDDLTRASGWQLKPEGACFGDVCVPIPIARRDRFVRDESVADARFNLAEFARLREMPSLYDEPTQTWCFADGASTRARQMASLQAPNFTLPDLTGAMHSLTDYRGQKIFMIAWASW